MTTRADRLRRVGKAPPQEVTLRVTGSLSLPDVLELRGKRVTLTIGDVDVRGVDIILGDSSGETDRATVVCDVDRVEIAVSPSQPANPPGPPE